ncbi:hypothetical protein [Flavobacterium aestivum]|uniref:hypothetical protein n=1 Tax=Flavobacterium aestivum TaxID=3003257 RepID=UPI00248303D8|nr:hypothetical protein [Flavobacterium aestivum]
MNNKVWVILLLLVGQYCIGQTKVRQSLHGQVVNDSIAVENGYVFNLNSRVTTFIGKNGFFDILAMPKDTLLITSLALKPKKMILADIDFKEKLYIVEMELFNNQLKEVVVGRKITPKIAGSQEIVDKQFFDDSQSSPLNRTMPYYGIENGINFVRVGKMVAGLFKKKDTGKTNFIQDEIFIDKVQRQFGTYFFTNTLKLKEEEINLFLIFCDSDENAKKVLSSKDNFQMVDFLINKNIAFKKLVVQNKTSE